MAEKYNFEWHKCYKDVPGYSVGTSKLSTELSIVISLHDVDPENPHWWWLLANSQTLARGDAASEAIAKEQAQEAYIQFMDTRHPSHYKVPFSAKLLRYKWEPATGTKRGDGHGVAIDPKNPNGIMRVDKCVSDNPCSLWAFQVISNGKKIESGYRASQVEAINIAEHIYYLHGTTQDNKIKA